ncbi:MAG: hypothetical protein AB1556_16540 [Bacillota bacterium]
MTGRWRTNEETPPEGRGVSSAAELNQAYALAEVSYSCLRSNWEWFAAPAKVPGNPGCRLASIIRRVEQN